MASRAFRSLRNVLSSTARSNALRTPIRRGMSTSSGGHSSSSDMPWMIGSALFFGPLFVWCLQPTKKTDHGHSAHGDAHSDHHKETADSKHSEPADEKEDTEAEAHLSEETSSEPKPESDSVADDEGVVVSSEDIKQSIETAVDADSPKNAEVAKEEESSK